MKTQTIKYNISEPLTQSIHQLLAALNFRLRFYLERDPTELVWLKEMLGVSYVFFTQRLCALKNKQGLELENLLNEKQPQHLGIFQALYVFKTFKYIFKFDQCQENCVLKHRDFCGTKRCWEVLCECECLCMCMCVLEKNKILRTVFPKHIV